MYTCREAIVAHLRASGPQEVNDLKHYCRIQATDYTPDGFSNALYALVREGEVIEYDADPEYDIGRTYEHISTV